MKKLVIISILLLGICCLFVMYYFYHLRIKGNQNSLPLSKHEKDIWILVDTSKSMRGYFRTTQNSGTTIQQFLWNGIIPILKESFPTDVIYFSPFGNTISRPQRVDSLLDQFRFDTLEDLQRMFSGTETRLIEVFRNVKDTSYNAFIIITDGVPSVEGGSGPAPDMINVVKALIETNKYYLWLIGVRSEFNGFIYPECPNQQGIRKSFHFSGKRPIFIWVGRTRDRNKGIEIVVKFLEKLRRISSSQDFNEIKLAELSFLDLPKAKLSLAKTEDVCLIYSKYPYEMRILKYKEQIDIPLKIEWVKEKLEKGKEIYFEIATKNFRGVSIENQSNEWYLRIIPKQISRKRLTINLKIKPMVERWWIDWSTDDDSLVENADKTLYLEPLVSYFLDQYLNKSYNIATIQIVIR